MYRYAFNGNGLRNWNCVQSYKEAVRKREVEAVGYAVQYAMTTYVSLIIDIAVQSIEEMYEYWENTKLFADNAKLSEPLTKCYQRAKQRYEFITSQIHDKTFFADLCDAGQDFARPYMTDLYEGFKELYKNQKCKQYNLIAYAATSFAITCAVGYRTRDLYEEAEQIGVKISGLEKYVMLEENKCLADIISDYGKILDDSLKGELSRISEGIAKALQPSQILKVAGTEAMRYNPDRAEEFKRNTSAIFQSIDWD